MAKYLDYNGLSYFWEKLEALFGGKVDKITGKELSTNDYTTAEKTKLAGIEAGANNYVLPEASTTLGGVKTTSSVTVFTDYTACPIDTNGVVYYQNTTYNNASSSASGLMSSSDYSKLAAFGAASTYALKSDISSVYKYKGSVATYSALPSNAESGDVYNVEDSGMNYAWTGTVWDALGSSFDITAITNSEIDTIMNS